MNVAAFARSLPALWDGDPQGADHPRDRRFRSVVETTDGMASENKLAVLNLATAMLDVGEVYLEIGSYMGTSVIGAALGNTEKRIVAVDNFIEFGGPELACRANLTRFGVTNVELVVDDGFDFLRSGRLRAPIGAYFYDGGHRFADHLAAIRVAEPHLADHAVVMVDDASQRRVRVANVDVTRNDPAFHLLFQFESARNGEPRWWNGLAIYEFHRDRRPRGWRPVPGGLRGKYHRLRYGPVSEVVARLRNERNHSIAQ